ncbi:MAG: DUF1614 domain-containing protein [Clostridia bacterium]|nr:MAG: DUF1614 domain-containing protein [Clostridia bacterium]
MAGFPVGLIALVVVSGLIYLGLAHRLLDRLYLSDRAALAVIAAMVIGSFIDVPVVAGPVRVSLNVGGALIPLGLAVYILVRAGTAREWGRALLATAVTVAVLTSLNLFVLSPDPWQTGRDFLDPLYVYPLVGGTVAYLAGRSRRAAFIAGTLGVLALDGVDYFRLTRAGIPGVVAVGGAGLFDAVVVSGLLAVLLAEVVGEVRERLQGGPAHRGRPEELLKNLGPLPVKKELPGGEDRDEV